MVENDTNLIKRLDDKMENMYLTKDQSLNHVSMSRLQQKTYNIPKK